MRLVSDPEQHVSLWVSQSFTVHEVRPVNCEVNLEYSYMKALQTVWDPCYEDPRKRDATKPVGTRKRIFTLRAGLHFQTIAARPRRPEPKPESGNPNP